MRLLAKALCVVVGFSATLACAQAAQPALTDPEKAGFSRAGLARIDTFFESEIKANRVPGAVVGIMRDGELVMLKAYGFRDKAKGLPMQTDTVFALASMTKPQVAVGVLALTQQGRLPLWSPLANYFPGFGAMQVAVKATDGTMTYVPQRRPIMVLDLLRHTSGLTYGGRPDAGGAVGNLYPSGDSLPSLPDSRAFIDKIVRLPLVYQPGTVWEYSVSFDVLAAVIEQITGKSLEPYLSEALWKPLGMVDTGFHLDPAKASRVAHPFPLDPLTNKPQRIVVIDEPVRFECGGGCSIGTVPDYLKFGQMLLDGGVYNDRRILSPQMVRLMTSNALLPDIQNNVSRVEPHRGGYGFGLGVAVRLENGLAAIPGNAGEFSWNGAYGTGFFVDPKERLVVVFGTAAPGELRKYYREQVQDLVYGAMVR